MTPTTIEIIAAPGCDVKIAGETVHVAEMPWTATLAFLKKLSGFIDQFIRAQNGQATINLSDMLSLVTQSESLATELIQAATGKSADWVGAQSPRAVLALLKAAIETNMTEELKNLGNDLGRILGFGAAPMVQKTPN